MEPLGTSRRLDAQRDPEVHLALRFKHILAISSRKQLFKKTKMRGARCETKFPIFIVFTHGRCLACHSDEYLFGFHMFMNMIAWGTQINIVYSILYMQFYEYFF